MMVPEIKISIGFISSFIKPVKKAVSICLNLYRRPKAHITIKNNTICTKSNDGQEHHHNYPCLLISFESDVKIEVSSIKLNNESYVCMTSRDPNFLKQNSPQDSISITNNKIMPFIKNDWLELNQKLCWFEIKANEQEVFPLYINQDTSNFIFTPKKDSFLFPFGRKICITININGINCEYGIPMFDFCKVVINNLAFK